jgi:hypothetical protein
MALSAQKVKTRCADCRTMQLWMWSWKSSENLHRFSFAVVAIMKFRISWSCKYFKNRPSLLCAALSLQCSVAGSATLWILICLYSTLPLFVFHRYTFLLRTWSKHLVNGYWAKAALSCLGTVIVCSNPTKSKIFFSCFSILLFYTRRGFASGWSPSKECYRIRGTETNNKITESLKWLRCFSN